MPSPLPFRPNARTEARKVREREQERQRLINKIGFHADREEYEGYLRMMVGLGEIAKTPQTRIIP